MPKFNDFDLTNWKELTDIETNSLWIVSKRDNSGKHSNFYHGNFIPQIPQQFIKRYTKKEDVVLDAFLGSGTTAYECEKLERNFIGIDLNPEMVEYVKKNLQNNKDELNLKQTTNKIFFECIEGDSADENTFKQVEKIIKENNKKAQLVLLHPPYFDIIKFSDKKQDLSNASTTKEFLNMFAKVVKNCKNVMTNNGYLIIVIGDKYANSEWIPLGFYCMQEAQKQGLLLKSIIIKNMEGNRAKQNQDAIWRYRALNSDYYIFKHEYIYVFKNI
ncbi:MAG: site-specific DNA-methyltransferase [Rickettsiales bacterium]|jgi:DNA modification methylase|nr:site-specific DNA-methyltransferase [Rickettsiales bacterium]